MWRRPPAAISPAAVCQPSSADSFTPGRTSSQTVTHRRTHGHASSHTFTHRQPRTHDHDVRRFDTIGDVTARRDFVPNRRHILHKLATRSNWKKTDDETKILFQNKSEQILRLRYLVIGTTANDMLNFDHRRQGMGRIQVVYLQERV